MDEENLTIEERMRILEASDRIQEQILYEIQAELIESDRLTNSVDRLGLNADALRESLLTVDRNQQALTRMGKQLDNFEAKAATKDEVEAANAKHERELRDYRKKVMGRAYLMGVGALVLLGVISLVVANLIASSKRGDYRQCLAGQQTQRVVSNFLESVRDHGASPPVRQSAAEAAELISRPRNCEALL